MARRPPKYNDMELTTIHQDLKTLNHRVDKIVERVEDVITIVGGSAALDYKGIRGDVRDLKTKVINLDDEILKIKQIEKERWSLSLRTAGQKFVAIIAALGLLLSIFASFKEIFLK